MLFHVVSGGTMLSTENFIDDAAQTRTCLIASYNQREEADRLSLRRCLHRKGYI